MPRSAGADWLTASEECELLSADDGDHDQQAFLRGETTPVLFTSAALNFGVNQLLDNLVRLAPAPGGQVGYRRRCPAGRGTVQRLRLQGPGRYGLRPPRSDRLRPRLLGHLRAGDVLTHAATGKPFVTKYAQSVFGQQRSTGQRVARRRDRPGQRGGATTGRHAVSGRPGTFPTDTQLLPEHFAVARGTDPSKHKRFRRGIEQLGQEGVVQILTSDRRGDQAPSSPRSDPAVQVASHRMAAVQRAHLVGVVALHRRTRRRPAGRAVRRQAGVGGGADPYRRRHARVVSHQVAAAGFQQDNPEVRLSSLVAAGDN